MDKLINFFLNISSYFHKNIIDIIIQYSDTLFISSSVKFKKKISTIKELTNNRIAIGYYTGGLCIYNLENGTQIINDQKKHNKSHITSICQINNNVVIYAMLNKYYFILWDFENNLETQINRIVKNHIEKNYVNDLTYLENNLITYTIRTSNNNYIMQLVNIITNTKIRSTYNISCFTKNNELIILGIKSSLRRINYDIQSHNIASFMSSNLSKVCDEIYCESGIYPIRIIPIDYNNYIISKTDDQKRNCIGIYNVKAATKNLIMESEKKINDILYINNNIVILSNNKVYIYNTLGELLQIIQHGTIKYMKIINLNNKLIIADNEFHLITYG